MAATILVTISLLLSVSEETLSVAAEGVAEGLGPAARNAAVLHAQTALVLSRIEALAPGRDYTLFESMLAAAPSYVRSYKLVREEKEEGSTRVQIEAELLEAKLKHDLAEVVLSSKLPPPTVLLLVTETLAPEPRRELSEEGIVESKLRELLRQAHFEVVDPIDVRAKAGLPRLEECVSGDPEAAAQLAREFLADIAVIGESLTTFEKHSPQGNLLKNTGVVSLKVIRATDAYIIDEPKADASVQSVHPKDGGRLALEDASLEILDDLKAAAAVGAIGVNLDSAILVTLKGATSADLLAEFAAAVKEECGAQSVQPVYSGKESARLRIGFDGPISSFVDAFSDIRVPGYVLRLRSVVARDMTVAVEKQ